MDLGWDEVALAGSSGGSPQPKMNQTNCREKHLILILQLLNKIYFQIAKTLFLRYVAVLLQY